jgi:hypothetical protein
MVHTEETRLGCVIVRGTLSAMDFVAYTCEAPNDFEMDLSLQRKLGATLVMGTPDNLKRLAADPYVQEQAERNVDAELKGAVVSQAVRTWLVNGSRGASSNFMLSQVTGLNLGSNNYPHDPADLGRCRKLCEQVPEVDQGKEVLKRVSGHWRVLIEHWQPLCELMDSEAPQWRDGVGTSPKTYALMSEIFDGAATL